jgi:hypothetical protein
MMYARIPGSETMPVQTRYLFIASMDVDPEKEAIFNEVYDQEHVPLLSKVPGVVSVTRLESAPLTMVMAGERLSVQADGEPRFSAIYEIESPEVLVSEAWAKAIDHGRWPTEVRPYTKNRRHTLKKVL